MAFDDGYKEVAAAGTAEPLSANNTPVSWVTIIAFPSNTQLIAIGDADVTAATGATYRGVGLMPNDWVTLEHVNLANVFIDSRVNDEGATFLFGG